MQKRGMYKDGERHKTRIRARERKGRKGGRES